ncbi:Nuclear cap-binding protein subunit 3 [Popillia japonica]|uniref:Nuclear cap-binding protein subunit 3 n=1 Tax=Popillia japonica TaxID=7064 RepID=A0AAW1JVN7_POPJA
MAGSTARPNIRIEIHNNLVEPMEVEEAEEEGEISDTNEAAAELAEESVKNQTVKQRIWPNTNGGFTTGINIFDKEEQSKLQERAKRFHLKPDEINNFTDEQLQALHDSLGINIVDEKDVRFEAVHVRGTDDMSTEDVLEYFGKYGPAAIEWIDDSSCNVLWNDRISAARALYFLSKPIKGMPIEGPCDPFAKELLTELVDDKENEGGRSILLKNKDRVVELRDDNDSLDQETVSISDIKIPIPPGFWRLGIECDKSKSILLRFAFKSDKKPHRAEKFSEYYKKYGNPNYGGLKGIITETHKKKFKGIFDRNKDISKEIEADVDPKNPWGALAMHWNEDFKYCEKVIADPPPIVNKNKSDIMSRLGFKRSLENPSEETEVAEKKTKMPRMRMYADEEEEKIKRKKQLQKLKLTATNKVAENNVDDLRNILRIQPRKTQKIEIKEDDNVLNVDLASRLKNRNRTASKPPRNDTAEEGPPVIKHIEHKSRLDHREYPKDRKRRSSYDRYEKKLYSDKPERQSPEESFDQHKPRSKIAVVIKTQKTPTVASAVWSRANSERQRLKTVSESKLRHRRSSSSESSESSSSSSSSSESDSSEESMDSIDEARVAYKKKQVKAEKMDDENVLDKLKNVRHSMYNKNSLRLEINNDYFIKK